MKLKKEFVVARRSSEPRLLVSHHPFGTGWFLLSNILLLGQCLGGERRIDQGGNRLSPACSVGCASLIE